MQRTGRRGDAAGAEGPSTLIKSVGTKRRDTAVVERVIQGERKQMRKRLSYDDGGASERYLPRYEDLRSLAEFRLHVELSIGTESASPI